MGKQVPVPLKMWEVDRDNLDAFIKIAPYYSTRAPFIRDAINEKIKRERRKLGKTKVDQ